MTRITSSSTDRSLAQALSIGAFVCLYSLPTASAQTPTPRPTPTPAARAASKNADQSISEITAGCSQALRTAERLHRTHVEQEARNADTILRSFRPYFEQVGATQPGNIARPLHAFRETSAQAQVALATLVTEANADSDTAAHTTVVPVELRNRGKKTLDIARAVKTQLCDAARGDSSSVKDRCERATRLESDLNGGIESLKTAGRSLFSFEPSATAPDWTGLIQPPRVSMSSAQQEQLTTRARQLAERFHTDRRQLVSGAISLAATVDNHHMDEGEIAVRFYNSNNTRPSHVEGVVELKFTGAAQESGIASITPRARVVIRRAGSTPVSESESLLRPLTRQRGDRITFAEALAARPADVIGFACSEAQILSYLRTHR